MPRPSAGLFVDWRIRPFFFDLAALGQKVANGTAYSVSFACAPFCDYQIFVVYAITCADFIEIAQFFMCRPFEAAGVDLVCFLFRVMKLLFVVVPAYTMKVDAPSFSENTRKIAAQDKPLDTC